VPVPVIVDTDIGSSFDDTVCLAYILATPELDLVGISTVSGQSETRARYARTILEHYGVDVPVVAGLETALSGDLMQPQTVENLPTGRRNGLSGSGLDDLRALYSNAFEQYGGSLVILSIGPLTNLAHLDFASLASAGDRTLPRLVSMGGSLSGEREWNVLLDPEAAGMILGSPGADPDPDAASRSFSRRTLLPIETTRRLSMPASEAAKRIPRHLTEPFGGIDKHPRHPGTVILHDPLAALSITQDSYCEFREGIVEITTTAPGGSPSDNRKPRGSCVFTPREPGKSDRDTDLLSAAIDVDPGAALNAILSPLS
jgi:purine nucleosidase